MGSEVEPLKSCPFCGEESNDEPVPYDALGRHIRCSNCGATSRRSGYGSIEDAWNRRAMPPGVRAVVDVLRVRRQSEPAIMKWRELEKIITTLEDSFRAE